MKAEQALLERERVQERTNGMRYEGELRRIEIDEADLCGFNHAQLRPCRRCGHEGECDGARDEDEPQAQWEPGARV